MSASIQNNTPTSPVAAEKVKKPALSAQSTKHMVFGNWLIERLVGVGLMTTESVNESRKILGMWSSVDEQIALYDGFTAELKINTKEMKLAIRQFHKPPKAVKKAKTAASEGEKKRGRKKKEVVEEQDPVLALNERLVAAALSDEPIVSVPEFVRAPKEPEPQVLAPEPVPNKKVDTEVEKPVADKAAEKATKDAAKADEKATKDAAKVLEKATKDAAKVLEKATKDAAKAEEKATKDAAKAEEKATKVLEKATKDATKVLEKAAKAAEKEVAKAAEKEVAKAAKPVKEPKKKELAIPVLVRNSPIQLADADDEEEEEELECDVFQLNGVEYLRDSDNTVYDRNTQAIIGKFDPIAKTINKH